MSAAWKARPVPLWRILERLEEEHMRHGGQENGNLFVSYKQFVDAGVSKKTIRQMIDVGVALGLLEVMDNSNKWRGDVRPPASYRLTYIPAKGAKVPTDEWKRHSSHEDAKALVKRFGKSDKNDKPNQEAQSCKAA